MISFAAGVAKMQPDYPGDRNSVKPLNPHFPDDRKFCCGIPAIQA
jgi:hypothetical protein